MNTNYYQETIVREINPFHPEELGQLVGQRVRLHGSIYKIRRMSGFAFVLLRTGRSVIQCVYGEDFSHFSLDLLKEEAAVEVTADVAAEERSRTGWELRLESVRILSEPAEESPIVINQKQVGTSLEKLLDYRPVTLRNERQRSIFKLQEGIVRGFRRFLQEQDFTEIHTPKIVYAGAEGGANIFRLDYFGKEAYLAQSPQFYKQMMVGVFERVFEIGPVFRAEKHDTSRHLNEYTGVDFEMGYIHNFEELMDMETGMLRTALEELRAHYAAELAMLQVKMPVIETIPRIRFRQAKELIAAEGGREVTDWNDFEPEEEKCLCELIKQRTGSEFVFVTHYPTAKRPFYAMEDPENPAETLSFDLLFRGLEITTGGQRIHEYQRQVEKLRARGMEPEAFESYLMIHRYGMPPHGGLGLGLERFTARLLELENVRQACLFPRDIHRVTP